MDDANPTRPKSTRTVIKSLIVAFVALVGVTAFGLWLSAFGAPRDFWLLVSILSGLVVVVVAIGSRRINRFRSKKRRAFVSTGLAVLAVVGYVGIRTIRSWPAGIDLAKAASSAPQATASPTPGTNPPSSGGGPAADDGKRSQPTPGAKRENQAEPRELARRPERPTQTPPSEILPPTVAVIPPSTSDEACELVPPDEQPRVTLRPGDLVVANGRALYRLDLDLKERKIVEADYLDDTRGLVVEPDGKILLSTMPCGKGALVRVDPMTGKQTVVARGFKVPMGIAVERERGTVLVGDEWGTPVWGYLWRLDLRAGTIERVHTFQPSAVATSIAIHPQTGEIFFAARTIFRMRDGSPRSLGFDELNNVHAMTFTPQGEMYIAEYDGPFAHMRVGNPRPLESFNGSSTTWSAASSLDGKHVFFASAGSTSGRVHRLRTGDPNA